MGRKFDSVFLPTGVHRLAPVIADVKSGNKCTAGGGPHGGRQRRDALVGHAALVTARHSA